MPGPYEPGLMNFDVDDSAALRRFLIQEFQSIYEGMQELDSIMLEKLNVAPTKTFDGMVVLADGTNWDPGSGAGFYGYNASAWHFLG